MPDQASLAAALADPQFRSDLWRNTKSVPADLVRALLAGTLGAPGDLASGAVQMIGGLSSDPTMRHIGQRAGEGHPLGSEALNQVFEGYGLPARQPGSEAREAFASLIDPAALAGKGMAKVAAGAMPTMLPMLPILQAAFHGTPHQFDKFDLSKIGTGEGAQAFGHGLYFAENPAVAQEYRSKLSSRELALDGQPLARSTGTPAATPGEEYRLIGNQTARNLLDNDRYLSQKDKARILRAHGDALHSYTGSLPYSDGPRSNDWPRVSERLYYLADALEQGRLQHVTGGRVYKTDIPDKHELLDLDKPLSQQPEGVRKKLEELKKELPEQFHETVLDRKNADFGELTGRELRQELERWDGALPRETADMLGDPEKNVSLMFNQFGIPGAKFFDGTSRKAGEGTHNFVIWDQDKIKMLGEHK